MGCGMREGEVGCGMREGEGGGVGLWSVMVG